MAHASKTVTDIFPALLTENDGNIIATSSSIHDVVTVSAQIFLPRHDNTSLALAAYRNANELLRRVPWPPPYDRTTHAMSVGDARDVKEIGDGSVHLIVTSPPYWNLKRYNGAPGQLGKLDDYPVFLRELDKVWAECLRVLVPGGRLCVIVGDVCVSRNDFGRHLVVPLHADIQSRARAIGLDVLTPILWSKVANGSGESRGNGAGFYGKPYQPGAVVKNDIEYVLLFRKGGEYRRPDRLQKALSMHTESEMKNWLRSSWSDIPGASLRNGHPAPFPEQLAMRVIKLFSFAGDVVFDPFAGSGTTAVAAIATGRNSVGIDIEKDYVELAIRRIEETVAQKRSIGATSAQLTGAPPRNENTKGPLLL